MRRRIRILLSCAFILLIALIVWMICFRRDPPGFGPREIANALVGFHHCWETNGYRPPGTGLPAILQGGLVHASSAGMHGAYVQYHYGMLGVEWSKRYHILRANTNDTVWTLYEIGWLERPQIPWLSWGHKMITVTNGL
jgi:hypothetical protein